MAPIDRLTALDAASPALGPPRAPLQVGWPLRFGGEPPPLSTLRRHMDARLDRLPRFRRRLADLPGGIAWVDDAGFDIARHVHQVSLPDPAGTVELRELAGRLLSQPLDRARPLWRMYLVDGLNDGFALIGQAHHALVDGIAAIEVAVLLFDDGTELVPSTWRAAPGPSNAHAATDAARARVGGGLRAMAGAARAATHPRGTAGALREAAGALTAAASPAPPTSLDRSVTNQRIVAFGSAPFDEVRAVGKRRGATVNDVLLAATTIALGRALARRGERPHALKTLIPVSTRAPGTAADLGNAVSFAAIELPLGEPDPTNVLRTVRDRTRAAKEGGTARPLAALAQAGDLLPAVGRRAIARTAIRLASFNAVVSNVPGPPVELHLLGRPLHSIHPAVPLIEGHGLTVCGLSYGGRLWLGVYADAAVVPDVLDVARDIEAAFDPPPLAPERRPRRDDTRGRSRPRARRGEQRAARR